MDVLSFSPYNQLPHSMVFVLPTSTGFWQGHRAFGVEADET